ncbi:MAG TPA: response regulator [Chloroflexota bacterium]|nr:response regulator [Chloroflexota bacterium]
MSATIAVIEDDRDILELVCEVLEADGYRAAGFTSPDLAAIIDAVPEASVFLIDLMLPGTTGVELASRLRRSAFPHTPMIAMSASRLMLEVAGSSGIFDELVAKPFNLSTLLQHIERHAQGDRRSSLAPPETAAS